MAIVKAIQWVIEQGKCLLGLAKRVGEAVGPLVAGNAAGVAAVIFSVLGPVLEKLLGLLFKVLGITNISSFVKKAIAGIESRIKKLKDDIVDILTGKKRTSGKGCVKCKPGMKKKKTSKKLTGGIRGCGQCFVLAEDSRDGNGVPKLMGEHRMGQRIQTWLPGEVGYAESLSRPDEEIGPTTHRVVWFMQEFDDGHWKKFGLLRSVEWLSETGITEVGDWVDISELDEMGVEGEFQVMAIDPCPPIEPGPGRIITGEFHFSKGLVYNLRISGQEKPIRGTSQHPYFSADRNDWVPMAELRVGERLLIEGGTTVVLGLEEAGEEPVCNIEVDGDHCYRVGASGVLVHNASEPKTEAGCICTQSVSKTATVSGPGGSFSITAEVIPGTEKDQNPEVCRVLKISGPLKKTSGRSQGAPQSKMRAFLLAGDAVLEAAFAAGHVIADTLGGPNTTWNLVPMADSFNNSGGWKSMELRISSCLEGGSASNASMVVDVGYPMTGQYKYVPNKIVVTITINGRAKKPIVFRKPRTMDSHEFAGRDCLGDW